MNSLARWMVVAAIMAIAGVFAMNCRGNSEEVKRLPLLRLPAPQTSGGMSLNETLATRRSVRRFTDEVLSMEQIGQLTWAGQGITEPGRGLRTAPSAGAIYPLQLFVVTPDRLYRYEPANHSLLITSGKDLRPDLAAAIGQQTPKSAPLDLVIAADMEKLGGKYGDQALRLAYLEAGHVAENILLEAMALGLGGVPIGGFDATAVNIAMSLPANYTTVYVLAIGHPAK